MIFKWSLSYCKILTVVRACTTGGNLFCYFAAYVFPDKLRYKNIKQGTGRDLKDPGYVFYVSGPEKCD